MLKKISIMALAGLLALPAVSSAAPSADELARKIDQLSRELDQMRKQMEKLKEESEETLFVVEDLEDKSEGWDLSSRIQLSGDFRTRIDYVSADVPAHFTALQIANGVLDFQDVSNNFQTAFGAQAAASADGGASLMGATLSDLMQAMQAGVPVGTANATALTDLGAILASGTLTTPGHDKVMLGLLPGIDGSTTFGQVATQFGGLYPFGGSKSNVNTQNVANFMRSLTPGARLAAFNALGYQAANNAGQYDNDILWTNRLRLNLRAKVTEDVTFKGRLAMYKAWGMQNNPVDYTYNAGMGGGPFLTSSVFSEFDGGTTRQPSDSAIRVDRAYINWSNIADQPVWFSIGRRPSAGGPPGQLRQGLDQRVATPTAYMDYPFDGFTLGYAYNRLFGINDFPGKIRFCYGRGFESGPTDNGDGLNDVDFAGISWDVYSKGNRFFAFQSFGAFNVFNVPDNINFVNPMEFQKWRANPNFYNPIDSSSNLILDRANLGNIYHTTAVYMDKKDKLNYFLSLGWSRTDPAGYDELGTSLLGGFWSDLSEEDGYAVYAGLRYDMPEKRLKLGLEYNYGSKNWIAFTPGHDDLYLSKLATRGHVGEAYLVYDFPAGEKISKFADFFMRFGYMHYEYEYTGSGFWLGSPVDVDEVGNEPLDAQFYAPVESMDQVYLSFEAYF